MKPCWYHPFTYLVHVQDLDGIRGSGLELLKFGVFLLDSRLVLCILDRELIKVNGVQDFAHFFLLFQLELELISLRL